MSLVSQNTVLTNAPAAPAVPDANLDRPAEIRALSQQLERLGMGRAESQIASQILLNRGILPENLESFIRPQSADQSAQGLFKISEFISALTQITQARDKVAIYCDFDVDGQSSAAIFARVLQAHQVPYAIYFSNRHNDGYDLNQRVLERAFSEGCKSLIAVDHGTHKGELLRSMQLRYDLKHVIVLDHHICTDANVMTQPGIYINPWQSADSSGLRYLSGSGVALLSNLAFLKDNPGNLGDAAAYRLNTEITSLGMLGTVADIVPLKAANRWIVNKGLSYAANGSNQGIRCLARLFKRDLGRLSEEDIGFFLGSAINAASRVNYEFLRVATSYLLGRMRGWQQTGILRNRLEGCAKYLEGGGRKRTLQQGLKQLRKFLKQLKEEFPNPKDRNVCHLANRILLSSSLKETMQQAYALYAVNRIRQALEFASYQEAKRLLQDTKVAGQSILLLKSDFFDTGLNGLLASRLAAEYKKPVIIVASAGNGLLRASMRSGPSCLHVKSFIDQLGAFVKGGGHQAAGGFSLSTEFYAQLASRVQTLANQIPDLGKLVVTRPDLQLKLNHILSPQMEFIWRLAPFGAAFPAPRVLCKGLRVLEAVSWRGEHLRLTLLEPQHSTRVQAFMFKHARHPAIFPGGFIDVTFSLHRPERRNKPPKLIIEELQPARLGRTVATSSLVPSLQGLLLNETIMPERLIHKRVKRGSPPAATAMTAQETQVFQQSPLDLQFSPASQTYKNMYGEERPWPVSIPDLINEFGIKFIKKDDRGGYRLRFNFEQIKFACAFLSSSQSFQRKAPTGKGKTVEAVLAIAALLSQPIYRRALVVVPTDGLKDQWQRRLNQFLDLPNSMILQMHASTKAPDRAKLLTDLKNRIIITTPDLLLRYTTPGDSSRGEGLEQLFDLAILDESHLMRGDHPLNLLSQQLRIKNLRTLYLSATPKRTKVALRDHLYTTGSVYSRSAARPNQITEETHFVELSGQHREAAQLLNQSAHNLLQAILEHSEPFEQIYTALRKNSYIDGASGALKLPPVTCLNRVSDQVSALSPAYSQLKREFFDFYRITHAQRALTESGVLSFLAYSSDRIMRQSFVTQPEVHRAFHLLAEGTPFLESYSNMTADPNYRGSNILRPFAGYTPQGQLLARSLRHADESKTFINHPKDLLLKDLLIKHKEIDPGNQSIVFSREAAVVQHLTAIIQRDCGIAAMALLGKEHGAKNAQVIATRSFSRGQSRCLVSTSAGELGLDVARANLVFHHTVAYEPEVDEQRNGRAGRGVQKGLAYRLLTAGSEEPERLARILAGRKRLRMV